MAFSIFIAQKVEEEGKKLPIVIKYFLWCRRILLERGYFVIMDILLVADGSAHYTDEIGQKVSGKNMQLHVYRN